MVTFFSPEAIWCFVSRYPSTPLPWRKKQERLSVSEQGLRRAWWKGRRVDDRNKVEIAP
jgi:hypothetical protein